MGPLVLLRVESQGGEGGQEFKRRLDAAWWGEALGCTVRGWRLGQGLSTPVGSTRAEKGGPAAPVGAR